MRDDGVISHSTNVADAECLFWFGQLEFFLSTNQQIGWEERLKNVMGLFSVEWYVEPQLNETTN